MSPCLACLCCRRSLVSNLIGFDLVQSFSHQFYSILFNSIQFDSISLMIFVPWVAHVSALFMSAFYLNKKNHSGPRMNPYKTRILSNSIQFASNVFHFIQFRLMVFHACLLFVCLGSINLSLVSLSVSCLSSHVMSVVGIQLHSISLSGIPVHSVSFKGIQEISFNGVPFIRSMVFNDCPWSVCLPLACLFV